MHTFGSHLLVCRHHFCLYLHRMVVFLASYWLVSLGAFNGQYSHSSLPVEKVRLVIRLINKCGQYAPFGRRTPKPLRGLCARCWRR